MSARDLSVHELMQSMSHQDRLVTLVCSVIQSKPDAIDSAFYLVNSASVIASMALTVRGKLKLIDQMRDVADLLEHEALQEGLHRGVI